MYCTFKFWKILTYTCTSALCFDTNFVYNSIVSYRYTYIAKKKKDAEYYYRKCISSTLTGSVIMLVNFLLLVYTMS